MKHNLSSPLTRSLLLNFSCSLSIVAFLIILHFYFYPVNSGLFTVVLFSCIALLVFCSFFHLQTVLHFVKEKSSDSEKQKIFFEQTFMQSCYCMGIFDKNGWCIRINPKMSEFIGLPPEKVEGRFYNILKDEDLKKYGIDLILKRVFTDQKVEEWEVKVDMKEAAENHGLNAEGRKKEWFSCRAYPITGKKKKLLNVVLQYECITERKETENVIKESEKRFRDLFNKAPVGYHEIDTEGKIIRVNQTELDMLGYTEEEMIGSFVWEYNVDKFLSRQAVMKKITGNEECEKNIERTYQRKNGTTIPVLINDILLYDHEKNCIGVRTAIQDITKRKMYEEEIKRINQELSDLLSAKDKFLSIIAHDLLNPFSIVIGFSDLLREDVKRMDFSTIEEYLRIINDSSKQAVNLLQNLLEWAKILQGKITFDPVELNVHEMIVQIIDFLKESARLKNITIENQIPIDLQIKADKHMIRTLFRNLISNSIKFSNPEGKIEIAVKDMIEIPGKLVFSVQDYGVGIKAEHIDRIFNIGSKHITDGTHKEKGTGLGLIFCKEFVEKHGGKIWVESEPDKGSTFKFTLPQNICKN